MTTTELIDLLKKNEHGGASGRPREISLRINGRSIFDVDFIVGSTGDGIAGAEICLYVKPQHNPLKNCYTCRYGGDGEEICDDGHCWKHNGEEDFYQPPRADGCFEWEERNATM